MVWVSVSYSTIEIAVDLRERRSSDMRLRVREVLEESKRNKKRESVRIKLNMERGGEIGV